MRTANGEAPRRVFGDELHERVLDSGLSVSVVRKPSWRRVYGLLCTDFGSIDLDFSSSINGRRNRVPAGVAHFLEHKMFEKKDGDVMDAFSRLGCSSNAMTSFNFTGYLVECTEHVDEALELLVDFVYRPWFTEKLVEKEKGIIGEEIKMYLDDPGWRGFMGLLSNLYGKHPLAVDIAGTLETIAATTAADLQICHDSFYVPGNMHLAVAGPVDPDAIAEMAARVIARNGKDRPVEVVRHRRAPRATPRRRRTREALAVSNEKLHLGWKIDAAELGDVSPLELEVALDMALGAMLGRGAPVHRDLFRKGLLDDSFSYDVYAESGFAFVVLGGDGPDAAALERELVAGIERVLADGLPRADLRRMRRKLYGDFVRSFDSVSALCWNLAECFLKGGDFAGYGDLVMSCDDERCETLARGALRPDRLASHLLVPGS